MQEKPTPAPDSNTTLERRANVLALFQAHAEQAIARGDPPKGLEQAFAVHLQISPSLWSQIKSSRPIGDKLARQIESLAGKAAGWLDRAHEPQRPAPGETAFVALAREAWRASDAAGRRALRQQMKQASRAAATGGPLTACVVLRRSTGT